MTHKLLFWVVPFFAAMTAVFARTAFETQTEAEFKGATVDEWAASLKADDVETRRLAAATLAEMGGRARAARTELIEALDDADPEVRRLAAQSLGNIGVVSRELSTLIADKLAEGDMAFQREGVRALRNIVRPSPIVQQADE
jgi:HEAT repeat protein